MSTQQHRRDDQHDGQVDLPGQTFVAEGPHDQTGMYVMHHAFRRDLDRMVAAVRHTPVGEREVWAALLDRWQRFAETLHHHHQVEDVAFWPVLVAHAESAGAADDVETLRLMEAEHEGIDPALRACHDGFASMVEHPCEDHRHALDIRVTGLREALLDHLRHEETLALPMLQRLMSAEEFAAAEKHAQRAYPLRTVPWLVPWLLQDLPDDGRRRILTAAGPAYRLLAALTRRRYERGDRRAFRYV